MKNWNVLEEKLKSFYEANNQSQHFHKDAEYLRNAYAETDALWKEEFNKIDAVNYIMFGEAPLFGEKNSYFYNVGTPLTSFYRHFLKPIKSAQQDQKDDLLKKSRG